MTSATDARRPSQPEPAEIPVSRPTAVEGAATEEEAVGATETRARPAATAAVRARRAVDMAVTRVRRAAGTIPTAVDPRDGRDIKFVC